MFANSMFRLLLFVCVAQRFILVANAFPENKQLQWRRVKKSLRRLTELHDQNMQFQDQKLFELRSLRDERMRVLHEGAADGEIFASNSPNQPDHVALRDSIPAYFTSNNKREPTNKNEDTAILAKKSRRSKHRLTRSPEIETKHLFTKISVNKLASVLSPDYHRLMGFISPPANCDDKCWTRTASGDCQMNLRCFEYRW